jgi:hypothetical protein
LVKLETPFELRWSVVTEESIVQTIVSRFFDLIRSIFLKKKNVIDGNEAEIGEALKKAFDDGIVKREELFVQCKLWNTNHRPEHVKPDLLATLKDLQLDYVDRFVFYELCCFFQDSFFFLLKIINSISFCFVVL